MLVLVVVFYSFDPLSDSAKQKDDSTRDTAALHELPHESQQ